jgi:hypothetical protein
MRASVKSVASSPRTDGTELKRTPASLKHPSRADEGLRLRYAAMRCRGEAPHVLCLWPWGDKVSDLHFALK